MARRCGQPHHLLARERSSGTFKLESSRLTTPANQPAEKVETPPIVKREVKLMSVGGYPMGK